MNNNPKKLPSATVSFLVVIILVVMLSINVSMYGADSMDGSTQVVLLLAAGVCCAISMWRYGIKFADIEESILINIKGASSALIMLFLIGALSGIWMLSGVVPSFIYYGLKIINPDIFLFTACIVSAVVSLCTGSSWTTCATIGVALMGVGSALGFSEGWVAGAIISGAYFGDKMSPLSDTTNLAAGAAGTELFTHIRYLLITTIPSILIACIVYLVVGFFTTSTAETDVAEFTVALNNTYNLSPIIFIVPLLTAVLIAKKVAPLITLFLAVIMGSIAAIVFQPQLCIDLATNKTNIFTTFFTGVMNALYGATSVETGNEALNELVATRGMSGMMNTIWLILCSMCFGGAMQASGMLTSITNVVVKWMRTTFSTVAATVSTSIMLNVATADQYVSIILSGKMFSAVYKKMGYEPRLLSRTLEDSATVTSVLIPWNSCSMAQSTVLSVSAIVFAPYCIFNWISPIVSVMIAATGYKIKKRLKPE
ncbi:MAG: Na+/H+ antiporter NhaC family protein [Bacteroidales bacterium]